MPKPQTAGSAGTTMNTGAESAATASADDGQAAAAPRVPMQEPEGGWPPDEFTGKFGHYVRDPYTGKRSIAPPADPAAPAA